MKLNEFFEEIAYGELSDLALAEGGEIKPQSQPLLTIKLNDALLALHTKYVLRLEDLPLTGAIPAGTTRWDLSNPHAVRIIYVDINKDTDDGFYKFNGKYSIKGNTIYFLEPGSYTISGLKYQWKPLKLLTNPAKNGFLNQEIDVDPVIIPLVRTQVAASVFLGMNGELHKKTGMDLHNFSQILQADLESSGILNTSVGFADNQFEKNGFK